MAIARQRTANALFGAVGGLCLLALAALAAAQDLPVPRNHVEDRAGVISASVEQRLISVLADLERKTGAQVIVLTVNTTGGTPIEDYTLALAERWKLGQKGKDNGALAVIAVKDRKYWITIGYGLESVLPDGFVGTIGRTYFRPYFQKGDYSNGIYQGMLALVQKVAEAENVTISGAVAPTRPRGAAPAARRVRGYSFCGIVPLIFMVIVLRVLFGRRSAYRRWGYGSSSGWLWMLLLGSMMMGGRRGGWGGGFGGGGFGGGGFGGGSFGGGGGGSFGGGGAGGGW